MTEPIWITEQEVAACVDLIDAIDAVEQGFQAEAAGSAMGMAKTHVRWGAANTLHALGAAVPAWGLVGTKTWAHTEGGACPLLLLFDAETGALRAIIEAFALGQLRTAAATGVATRHLAPAGAGILAQIGTGKQALAQVAAVAAVRKLTEIRVFSPNPERRSAFLSRVAAEIPVPVTMRGSVHDTVVGADIVTVATRATAPFIDQEMIAGTSHINAIGAITPERAELAADVVASAGLLVADSVEVASRLSREFSEYKAAQPAAAIHSLADLVTGKIARPHAGHSIFKAMGTGLADLAVGHLVYERVRLAGGGRPIPLQQRVKPRLTRP